MSHSDKISIIPDSFQKIASSDNCEFAVIQNQKETLWCSISPRSGSHH